MLRIHKQLIVSALLAVFAVPVFGQGTTNVETKIIGLENIAGKWYASSQYKLWVVAVEKDLPTRSIEIKVDDGTWTVYSGSQLQSWTEGNQRFAKSGKFSIAQEGMHTITTRVTDILGNRSREQREVVFIDNTSPEAMMQSYYFKDAASLDSYKNPDADLKSLREEADSAYLNNGSVYVGPNYALLIEAFDTRAGVRNILYRFNKSTEWTAVKRVVPNQDKATDRGLCALDQGETVVTQDVQTDDAMFTTFFSVITKGLDPGWNVIQVRLQDMVYNCSEVIAFPIYFDNFKPVAKVTPQIAFPILNGNELRISTVDNKFDVTATDAGSGIRNLQIRLDSAEAGSNLQPEEEARNAQKSAYESDDDWHDYVRPISFVTQAMHRIWVRAVDNVGNISDPYLFDLSIVINPPGTLIRGLDPFKQEDVNLAADASGTTGTGATGSATAGTGVDAGNFSIVFANGVSVNAAEFNVVRTPSAANGYKLEIQSSAIGTLAKLVNANTPEKVLDAIKRGRNSESLNAMAAGEFAIVFAIHRDGANGQHEFLTYSKSGEAWSFTAGKEAIDGKAADRWTKVATQILTTGAATAGNAHIEATGEAADLFPSLWFSDPAKASLNTKTFGPVIEIGYDKTGSFRDGTDLTAGSDSLTVFVVKKK